MLLAYGKGRCSGSGQVDVQDELGDARGEERDDPEDRIGDDPVAGVCIRQTLMYDASLRHSDDAVELHLPY